MTPQTNNIYNIITKQKHHGPVVSKHDYATEHINHGFGLKPWINGFACRRKVSTCFSFGLPLAWTLFELKFVRKSTHLFTVCRPNVTRHKSSVFCEIYGFLRLA